MQTLEILKNILKNHIKVANIDNIISKDEMNRMFDILDSINVYEIDLESNKEKLKAQSFKD